MRLDPYELAVKAAEEFLRLAIVDLRRNAAEIIRAALSEEKNNG